MTRLNEFTYIAYAAEYREQLLPHTDGIKKYQRNANLEREDMSIKRRIKVPAIALIATLAVTIFLVGCGGAQETAAPAAPAAPTAAAPQVAPPTNTPVVRATNTPVASGAVLPTPTQRASVLQATPRPTAVPTQQEGELVSERLIVVLDPPSLESMLDCEVTGSGVVNYRMSAEFMIDANRYDGEYEPTLATEWSISEDGMVWNFKLRQGVQWHDDWGEFTAQDVQHSRWTSSIGSPASAACPSAVRRSGTKPAPTALPTTETTKPVLTWVIVWRAGTWWRKNLPGPALMNT